MNKCIYKCVNEVDNHLQFVSVAVMKELNPINQKLNKLISAGLTAEVICAKAELKYTTFRQTFVRNRVTKMVMLSLLRAEVITEGDKIEYEKWFRQYSKPKKRKKRVEEDAGAPAEL